MKLCMFLVIVMVFLIVVPCQGQENNIRFAISEACSKYSIDEQLVYQIIEAESSFKPQAVSRCGARGLMQIMPKTWDWVCRDMLKTDWDFENSAFIPERNIEVGVRYLRWITDYLDMHKNELNASRIELILACYNAGPGNVRRAGFRVPDFSETINYIAKITANYKQMPI